MITFAVYAVDEFGRVFSHTWQPPMGWADFSEDFKSAIIVGSLFRRLVGEILVKMGTEAKADWSGAIEHWEL